MRADLKVCCDVVMKLNNISSCPAGGEGGGEAGPAAEPHLHHALPPPDRPGGRLDH